jgi:hypothetical protein
MENPRNQKEILLMVNASFFSKRWVKLKDTDGEKKSVHIEELIEACWNGITPQILPECFEHQFDNSVTLWEITTGNVFIDLEFSVATPQLEKIFSVNPYVFLQVQCLN